MELPQTWPPDAVESVQALIRDNVKLVTRMMAMQREASHVTDVEIRDRFVKLYNAIIDWVRDAQQDLSPTGWSFEDFGQALKKEEAKVELVKLLRWTEHAHTDAGKFTPDDPWVDWLAAHTTSLYVVLTLVIWRCLEKRIFNLHLPVGVELPPEAGEVLNAIMETMNTAEEGEVSSKRWKSATMTALTQTEKSQDTKKRRVSGILVQLLNEWPLAEVSHGLSHIRTSSLEDDIIGCAVKLQEDMACSTTSFRKEYPAIIRGDSPEETKARQWNLRSIAQWIPVEGSRSITGAFHCLFPAIFRQETSGRERVNVVKPVVLVFDDLSPPTPRHLTTPIPRLLQLEQSRSPAPSPEKQHRERRHSTFSSVKAPQAPRSVPNPSSQRSSSETGKADKFAHQRKKKRKSGSKSEPTSSRHKQPQAIKHHTRQQQPVARQDTVPRDRRLDDETPVQITNDLGICNEERGESTSSSDGTVSPYEEPQSLKRSIKMPDRVMTWDESNWRMDDASSGYPPLRRSGSI